MQTTIENWYILPITFTFIYWLSNLLFRFIGIFENTDSKLLYTIADIFDWIRDVIHKIFFKYNPIRILSFHLFLKKDYARPQNINHNKDYIVDEIQPFILGFVIWWIIKLIM